MYRADHVGSFLRPKELLDARSDPRVGPERLREIEDAHVRRLLERQRDLGFRVFTDGELRRRGFMSGFYEAVEGLDRDGSVVRAWQGSQGAGEEGAASSPLKGIVVARLRQTRRLAKHEADFLLGHSPGAVKITLPTPNQFPAVAYRKGLSQRAYATWSDFLWDVVPIIRSEMQALLAEGVRYLQIDAPRYSYYLDPRWREYIRREMEVDPDRALDEAIRADNACLAGARREGVVVGMHLCRGNNRSQWYAEGGYDPIAEKLFGQIEVDVFLLEYESARAGTFEPLRFVPRDKGVVLGLVSSKVGELERQADVCRRIEEASRYLPLENLGLSPQCGFASVQEGNLLTEDEQWSKLRLVAEAARAVWGTT
jgi:5-methyltetrahydropteroyltriglutamate--homocysteine methyltransferase